MKRVGQIIISLVIGCFCIGCDGGSKNTKGNSSNSLNGVKTIVASGPFRIVDADVSFNGIKSTKSKLDGKYIFQKADLDNEGLISLKDGYVIDKNKTKIMLTKYELFADKNSSYINPLTTLVSKINIDKDRSINESMISSLFDIEIENIYSDLSNLSNTKEDIKLKQSVAYAFAILKEIQLRPNGANTSPIFMADKQYNKYAHAVVALSSKLQDVRSVGDLIAEFTNIDGYRLLPTDSDKLDNFIITQLKCTLKDCPTYNEDAGCTLAGCSDGSSKTPTPQPSKPSANGCTLAGCSNGSSKTPTPQPSKPSANNNPSSGCTLAGCSNGSSKTPSTNQSSKEDENLTKDGYKQISFLDSNISIKDTNISVIRLNKVIFYTCVENNCTMPSFSNSIYPPNPPSGFVNSFKFEKKEDNLFLKLSTLKSQVDFLDYK